MFVQSMTGRVSRIYRLKISDAINSDVINSDAINSSGINSDVINSSGKCVSVTSRSAGARQRFRDRASQGLSLCFALCEALIDAMADTQDDPADLDDGTDCKDDPQSVQGGDGGERALLQVLRNVDDVAGMVLQFVEQPGGSDDVVLAGIRVLGR